MPVHWKIFLSVLARRMTNYLTENHLCRHYLPKAGILGFLGWILAQIYWAMHDKRDLHVTWLDIANSHESVPNQLINYATEFFYMANIIRSLVLNYLRDLQMGFTLWEVTTRGQQLEVGIALGCSLSPISPIPFMTTFEIILTGARQTLGRVRPPAG